MYHEGERNQYTVYPKFFICKKYREGKDKFSSLKAARKIDKQYKSVPFV